MALSANEQPVEQPIDTKTVAGQAPRKKRRRTAAGGASEDCFSCRKGSVKCGRERPYCSQCMHAGTQCGGYKTTLTWGVGVASRGKLRGLSCPVANKNADGTDVSATEMEARRRKSSVSKIKREEGTSGAKPMATIHQHQPSADVAFQNTSAPGQASSYPPQSHSLPIPIPHSSNAWPTSGHFENGPPQRPDATRHSSFSHNQRPMHRPLQRLQTAFGSQWEGMSIPDSGSSVDSFTDHDLHSPLDYPHNPRSMSMFDGPLPPLVESFTDHHSVHSINSGSMDNYHYGRHGSTDTFNDPMSGSIDSISNASYHETPLMGGDIDPLDTALYSSTEQSFDPFDAYAASQRNDSPEQERRGMSLVDTRFSSPFFHLSPRMQSLMDYYDQHVCPFLVTFDGPENPYRLHILQLASQNKGLQNAIAALATNNLRMRRKESRSSGFVEEITDAFEGTSSNDHNEPSAEETLYKQMSIDQLNMQLADTKAAQDDSVLGTLLVLCLFHVCDSGFSKFKTQLAGMQKLLSLRDPATHSEFIKWVQMFFCWFDVMTSTVNDREMQISNSSMDMLDYSANLGAMEQFSGCDGRLFKLIARLGRINLLAQGRPVRPHNTFDCTPRMNPSSTIIKTENKDGDFDLGMSALDYDNIDGNGWGSNIVSTEEEPELIVDENDVAPDERHEFWSEWYDMRTRLQSWQMDMSSLPPFSPDNTADPEANGRDIMHINESFRYSALLYTERLGHPILPSSHYQFQNLVSKALYHISSLPITSCVNKFLLWPLFIIGTECVDDSHRSIIRSRCIEVQKESGFFNNLSALEVLEKVWSEAGPNIEGREGEEIKARWRDNAPVSGARYGQAFRWRKAMDRAGGEYIVI